MFEQIHSSETGALSSEFDYSQIKDWLIALLEERPDHSIAVKALAREYCLATGTPPLKGERKREFMRVANKAIGALQREAWPKVKRYEATTNERIRLTPQYRQRLQEKRARA